MATNEPKFVGLPLSVGQPLDIGRLIREVAQIDEQLRQQAIRKADDGSKPPELSKHLSDLIKLNSVDILDSRHRNQLTKFLEAVKSRAPVVHISFSSEPSTVFIDKLIAWLRSEIHPLILLTIGLEPNIGAGCVVRTTNRYFDFSLKNRLKQNRPLLIEKIKQAAVPVKST